MDQSNISKEQIGDAAGIIKQGGLVIFPTETVYGLGADATNDDAVAKIFAAKERPSFNPLISHFANIAAVQEHVVWSDQVEMLANMFWPGPLTLVLSRKSESTISLLACAGLETVAVRVPAHPIAQAFLAATGAPIAAPSANRSGEISPTTAEHATASLKTGFDVVLDGGPCQVGLESTVLDLSDGGVTLLRPGAVTRERIENFVGQIALHSEEDENLAVRAPGMTLRHYAPATALRLNAAVAEDGEILLGFGGDAPAGSANLSPTGDMREAAANLFALLHELDSAGADRIAVMTIPNQGLGVAINDRLHRAAAG